MAQYFSSLADPALIQLIKDGAIGVIPTDTVYGLVARAQSEIAVNRLYALKARERQPGTTIGSSIEQLAMLGFPVDTLATVSSYWPGALSVELSAQAVPSYLSTNQPVMAARIPRHQNLLALLNQTGPLMTTSANPATAPTSTSIQMAIDYFGDTVDFYVDGGDLSGRAPSTIIGFDENGEVIVYRQGSVEVDKDMLSKEQHIKGAK